MDDIKTGKTFSLGELTIHIFDDGDVSAVIEVINEPGCEGQGCLVCRSSGRITPVFRRHKEARAEVLRFFKSVVDELKQKKINLPGARISVFMDSYNSVRF